MNIAQHAPKSSNKIAMAMVVTTLVHVIRMAVVDF
jgi:hypothetical protein